jgi:uncharacterized membrane protein YfcA
VRALLAAPLGFLIGFALGALGGGGSILAVPVLVYAAGQGARDATTTSLLVVAGAAAFGLLGHWRAGRVRWTSGLVFGLVGIGGSLLGTALNRHLDENALLAGFSLLILLAAWRMLTGCPSCTRVGEEEAILEPPGRERAGPASDSAVLLTRPRRLTGRRLLVVAAAGTAVGFLTGLFGVGGGFVIVPALTLALGFAMPEAIGTSLLVITINALVALAARGGPGAVEWPVALPFTVAALAGVAFGVRAADRLPARTLLRWFTVLLVGVAVFTGVQALIGLAR